MVNEIVELGHKILVPPGLIDGALFWLYATFVKKIVNERSIPKK
jgi:hypothetical protein